MSAVIVTGCFGLVGSWVSTCLSKAGYKVFGIDNDTRASLFDLPPLSDSEIHLKSNAIGLESNYFVDIRSYQDLNEVFSTVSSKYNVISVVHCAAQPSHDWAASHPFIDFNVNALGTLNLLELFRKYAPDASFIHFSTNKVYGDLPNKLPLEETNTRFDLPINHMYYNGITESFPIDNTKHSLFGCSKTAADLYVQEYRRYFGLNTFVLRGGCLTGPTHRGVKLHGFLSFLVKTAVSASTYEVIGYQGKQVRDNLHAADIASLVKKIITTDHSTMNCDSYVFNLGGGRSNSLSILEARDILKTDFSLDLKLVFSDKPRSGDHMWYISDNSYLYNLYNWKPLNSIHQIFSDLIDDCR